MACSTEDREKLKKMAEKELERLRKLKGQKYKEDVESDMQNIDEAIEDMENIVLGKDVAKRKQSILEQVSEAGMRADAYTSKLLIGHTLAGKKVLAPYLKKWHDKAMTESGIYRETMNALSEHVFETKLYNSIKATMFVTGDIDRKKLADLTTLVNTIEQENYKVLDEYLPKLDKKIEKTIKNKQLKEDIDTIFGKIGFINIQDGNINYLDKVEGEVKKEEYGTYVQGLIDGMNLSEVEKDRAEKLMKYMLESKVEDNIYNAKGEKRVAIAAALMALQKDNGRLFKQYRKMIDTKEYREVYTEIRGLMVSTQALHKRVQEDSSVVYSGYDEQGTIDVYETALEYKIVEPGQEALEEGGWKYISDKKKDGLRIMARKSPAQFMEGLGTNKNRIRNGVVLEKAWVEKNTKYMDENQLQEWLDKNNIVYDLDNGYPSYRLILSEEEKTKAGIKRNVAHTLYRTWTHNQGLIQTQKARSMIVEEMTVVDVGDKLSRLDRKIKSNKKLPNDRKKAIDPFIKSDLDYETLKSEYPEIGKLYVPVSDLTSYGEFNKQISYVRKDMKDMIVGHKQGSLFKDDHPNLQQWESVYKELVQMLKLKWVVANPSKLAVDAMSNFGVLMSSGVSPTDALKYTKEAWKLNSEMEKLRGDLVDYRLRLEIARAENKKQESIAKLEEKVIAQEKKIKEHKFYDALKYGFSQSMSTEMMLKDFDTISGLQNTLDTFIGSIMKDKEGKPTKVHEAVKGWMNAGIGMDDAIKYATAKAKLEGTKVGDELIAIADRLKDKKQTEDTVRYVNEFIAGPASEVVRQGSNAMQGIDMVSRHTLFMAKLKEAISKIEKEGRNPTIWKSSAVSRGTWFTAEKIRLQKAGITEKEYEKIKDEAGMLALDTFIDYRLNVPQDIKMLSDYGVLLFPSFWMRAQKIIWGLLKNHPLSAGGGYVTADLLDMNGVSFIDVNIVNKALDGQVLHAGQDVLSVDTILLGVFTP
jgi:hypothetical protein